MSTPNEDEAGEQEQAPKPSAPAPEPTAKEPSRLKRLAQKLERLRTPWLTLLLIASTLLFARVVHQHYPIQKWLFWRYAAYWLLAGFWALACTSAGHFTMRKVLPTTLPFREHLGASFALGVVEFYFLMSTLGLLRIYGTIFFVALPSAMLALGARSLIRETRRYFRHARPFYRRGGRDSLFSYAILAFGLLGFVMVYFLILTPENVQFDSRWKHFALAEQYVATSGIRRFPEGWTVATNPHLATFVYAWGFMLPIGQLFDRVELAAHLEFTIFVATTLMIPALLRRLVPGTDARFAWAARFLFPGVFLYDSSVSGGGDHIAALFTIPLVSLLLRARRDLSPRLLILTAAMLAGTTMSKLTGLLMLTPAAALLIAGSALSILIKNRKVPSSNRHNVWRGTLAFIAAMLVLTSTFWLKNWIWYGDPLYPSLYSKLALRPWTLDSANIFEWGYKDFQFWRPSRDFKGVLSTLKALFTFSFIPNDWGNFHGTVPVIGSLFSLLVFCLPFLKGSRRLLGVTFATYVALFVWYWTHHQDRYLQLLMPWMSTVTAGAILLLWRTGWPSRVALSTLVGFQIVWGGDVYFIQTHAMIKSPLKAVIDLLSDGHSKKYDSRFDIYKTYVALGKQLPKNARVLLHDNHTHLGIHAATVSDFGGWQFGISYGRQNSPREVYDLLTGMGVTHIAWEALVSRGWDSLAGDIRFFQFAIYETVDRKEVGSWSLAAMPKAPPQAPFDEDVALIGCNNNLYPSGLYKISDLTVPVFGPKSSQYPKPRIEGPPRGLSAAALREKANILVLDARCETEAPGFSLGARRRIVREGKGSREFTIWFRPKGRKLVPAP